MTTRTVADLIIQGQAARSAAKQVAKLSAEVKNQVLNSLASMLETENGELLEANAEDCAEARTAGLSDAMIDRLLLTPERLRGTADEQRKIAALPDPVGETIEMSILPNGMSVGKRRTPLGVIASIYESRPNVTVDIFGLCFKSGNACILRGGKEALRSNSVLVRRIRGALAEAGAPEGAVQFVDNPDRELVDAMLKMDQYIDLIVPRGGDSLVRFVGQNATMPAVTGGVGVCHTYIDRAADLDMAASVSLNAKVRRPYICNALDTLLVHSSVAVEGLPRIASALTASGIELHCDNRALTILGPGAAGNVIPAVEEDWGREFLSMTAAVKVVDSIDEALEHIETYGSGHSEAIITEDYSAAMRFLDEVDAAAVYVNASTQFTDGGQFGLGAEVGISTQKLHARGPMGLKELTSYKWVIMGSGQTRP